MKKYYNAYESEKAYLLSEINPLEAKIRYEQYMNKYPNDYLAISSYAHVLITLGDFELASDILKYVASTYENDEKCIDNLNRIKRIRTHVIYNQSRLLIYQEKYEEFKKLYLKYKDEMENMELDNIYLYCQFKLGEITVGNRCDYSYRYRQIIEYKEQDFLYHVQKHLYKFNENVEDQNSSFFFESFPFELVLQEVKKHIPSGKRLCLGFIDDTYVFKYDGCGKDGNKVVDYFKVCCFHNTDNIITMCPTKHAENLPCVDLNDLAYKIPSNVKILSQIDKFNKRYKK